MYRLAVFPISLPPLREREGDAELLAEHFLQQMNAEGGTAKRFSRAALTTIRTYHWPGNVRELKNAMERAAVFSDGVIGEADLPEEVRGVEEAVTLREFRDKMEREFILRKLEQFGWNVPRTAEALGIERTNLHRKLRAYGLDRRKDD